MTAALSLQFACGGGGGSQQPPPNGGGTTPTLASLTITPSHPSLAPGGTVQLAVTGTYSDASNRDLTASVTWRSDSATICTVSSGGLATGVTAGTTTLTASSGALSGSVTLTVTATPPPALTSLAITPLDASVAKGGTIQYTAIGTYSDASTQNLTATAAWSSSATSVATIAANGLTTAAAVGTTTIRASVGTISGSATLTVTATAPTLTKLTLAPSNPSLAAGSSQQMTVTGTYSDASTRDVTASGTWSSSTPAVASVSSGGLVTGLSPGTTLLAVQVGTLSTSTNVTVTAPATAVLTSVAVTPVNSSLSIGGTLQLTATGTYSDGTTQNVTGSAAWTSSAPAAATVNTSGLVTGVAAGSTVLTGTVGGLSGTTTVTVTAPTLTGISLSPLNPTLARSATQQMVVTGTYSDGTSKDVTTSGTWTSGTPAVASVSGKGILTGLAAGTSTISVTVSGMTVNTVVTVTTPTLQRVVVTPASANVYKGGTVQFTAIGTFSDGTTANLAAAWASDTTPIAAIHATSGLATGGVTGGTATITATVQGQSATATITNTTTVPWFLDLAPAKVVLTVGSDQAYTATARQGNGTPTDVTKFVTSWTTGDSRVATVTTKGVVTANGVGTTTVTASYTNGSTTITRSATITVVPVSLTSITLSPTSLDLATGSSGQFYATGHYNDGSALDITSLCAWTSSAPAVASVSATGNVSALTAGTATITAAMSGISVTGAVTSTVVTLTSIALTPDSFTMARHSWAQYTALGNYSNGISANINAQVSWMSSNPAVATVDANGVVTGVGIGSATISATLNGVLGSTTVTIVSDIPPELVGTWRYITTGGEWSNTYTFAADGTYEFYQIYINFSGCVTVSQQIVDYQGTFTHVNVAGSSTLYFTDFYESKTQWNCASVPTQQVQRAAVNYSRAVSMDTTKTQLSVNDGTGWLVYTKQP